MSESPSKLELHLKRERHALLMRVSRLLDAPMTILSFVWLGLLILEFTSGLSGWLGRANDVIWILFIAHFVLEFLIASDKRRYLRQNWLTAVSLLVPALRTLRTVRAVRFFMTARFGRGVRLLRWITSLNRGLKATQRTTQGRGLKYVLALTLVVNLVGAAGIYFFENPQALRDNGETMTTGDAPGIRSYGEALWWTSMMLTTMGSDYFPKTAEGRIISLLLAVYAFAIFGYITATVASLIIHVDQKQMAAASLEAELAEMRTKISRLMKMIQDMKDQGISG